MPDVLQSSFLGLLYVLSKLLVMLCKGSILLSSRTCPSIKLAIRHKRVNEVNVKATLKYHGVILSGRLVNKQHLLANTILSFMFVVLFGGSTFLWKILPYWEVESKPIFEKRTLILNIIKNAGGNVIIICVDNCVNQASFKISNTIFKLFKISNSSAYHW